MQSVEGRYSQLASVRSPFLERARKCAELTIPALLPPEGMTDGQKLYTPYQGIGAQGTNNLSSRLHMTLLPPNAPFFKFEVDDFLKKEITGDEEMRGEIEEALSSVERAVQSDIETNGVRVPGGEALKQLVVAGNVLLFSPPNGGLKVFRMDRYVVKRDMMGNALEIIVKENIAPVMLPPEVKALVAEQKQDGVDKTLDLYTYVARKDDKWEVFQEIKGKKIPGSDGSYPIGDCPWLALRLVRVDGEDYGRSYVEEHMGDLMSLEGLYKSIVEGSAAAAKMLWLVKPNGSTRAKTVAEAPNLAVREGNADDVTTLQSQKHADFRIALDTIDRIENRLQRAFLLNMSVQRSGERVTAEEIRRMSQDLEMVLGAIYLTLGVEFQLPLVQMTLKRLTKGRRIPDLPKSIKPKIVTGIEALGRGNDRMRLTGLLQDIQPFWDQLAPRFNVSELLARLAASHQVDPKGLFKTDQQVAQEQQQAMQQSALMGALPNAINAGGRLMAEGMKQGTPNEQVAQG